MKATRDVTSTVLGTVAVFFPLSSALADVWPLPFPGHALRAVDIDHDGDRDILVAADDRLLILENPGDGRFDVVREISGGGTNLLVGDLNGDLHTDVVIVDENQFPFVLRTYINRGDGTFDAAIESSPYNRVRFAQLAHMDRDGNLDLVAADGSDDIVWARYDNDGTFSRAGRARPRTVVEVSGLVAGDIEPDGDVDIALVGQSDWYGYFSCDEVNQEVLANRGHGAGWDFCEAWASGGDFGIVNEKPHDVVAGDFDNDGDLEFSFMFEARTPITSRCDARGNIFSRRYQYQAAIQVADIDGDGRLDGVTVGRDVTTVDFHRNVGNLEFVRQTLNYSDIDLDPVDAALDDINDDGLFDLLILTGSDAAIHVVPGTPLRPDRPQLTSPDFVRGEVAEVVVSRAPEGSTAAFFYSFEGPGASRGLPGIGGMVLDLGNPVHFAATTTIGADGTGSLQFTVPINVPRRPLTLQAVVKPGTGFHGGAKTNFVTRPIVD